MKVRMLAATRCSALAMAVAALAMLAMAALAMGATYNGTVTISTPTDELGVATYIGSGAAGSGTVVTVASGGSLYNLNTGSTGIQIATNLTAGTSATLVVDGGTVGEASKANTLAIGYGGGNTGILEIRNGGVVYANTTYVGRIASSTGAIYLYDGTLNQNTSTGNAQFGYGVNSTGTFVQSGGTSNFGNNVNVGSGTGSVGQFTVSGGTVNIGKQFYIGDADSIGRMDVIGSGATINMNGTMSSTNRFFMYANQSTLGFTIQDATGVSCINAYYTNLSGGTIDMTLSGYTPTDGATFDLLKDWDNSIDISKLVLAAGDEYIPDVQSGWTLQGANTIAGGTVNDTLQAVYHVVPEPATMGLLGLGLVGLVARRRRSMK